MALAATTVVVKSSDVATIGSGDTPATTITLADFVVSADDNQVLVVLLQTDGQGANDTPTSIKFDGTDLTQKWQRGHPDAPSARSDRNGPDGNSIWYLANPDVTTGDIVATGFNFAPDAIILYAMLLTGVDEQIPFTGAMRSGNYGDNQTSTSDYWSNKHMIALFGDGVFQLIRMNDGTGRIDTLGHQDNPNGGNPFDGSSGYYVLGYGAHVDSVIAGLGTAADEWKEVLISAFSGESSTVFDTIDGFTAPEGLGRILEYQTFQSSNGRTATFRQGLQAGTVWNGSRMETEFLEVLFSPMAEAGNIAWDHSFYLSGATAGTFVFHSDGVDSDPIDWDETDPAVVETAIEAMSNVTAVTVTGDGQGYATAWRVKFVTPTSPANDEFYADTTNLTGNVFGGPDDNDQQDGYDHWRMTVGINRQDWPSESVSYEMDLLEGTTVIHQATGSVFDSDGNNSAAEWDLTPADIDDITDFDDLRIRIRFHHATNGDPYTVTVTYFRLQTAISDTLRPDYGWSHVDALSTGTATNTDDIQMDVDQMIHKMPSPGRRPVFTDGHGAALGTEWLWMIWEMNPAGHRTHATDAILIPAGHLDSAELLVVSPAADADVGYIRSDNAILYNTGDIRIGASGSYRYGAFMRFPNVAIGQGKKIHKAWLRMVGQNQTEIGDSSLTTNIEAGHTAAFDEDDSDQLVDKDDWTDRLRTTAKPEWSNTPLLDTSDYDLTNASSIDRADRGKTDAFFSIGDVGSGVNDGHGTQVPWQGVYGLGPNAQEGIWHPNALREKLLGTQVQFGPNNLASVIQEIVDRGSWASGNALQLVWDINTSQFQYSGASRLYFGYDDDSGDTMHAELHIIWGDLAPPNTEQHNTDAFLKFLDVEHEHTTDASVQLVVKEDHTTDAILQAVDVELDHAADAILSYDFTLTDDADVTDAVTDVKAITSGITDDADITDQTTYLLVALQTHDTDALIIFAPQLIAPDEDISGTGWETAPVASQELFEQVNEDPADPADYVYWDN